MRNTEKFSMKSLSVDELANINGGNTFIMYGDAGSLVPRTFDDENSGSTGSTGDDWKWYCIGGDAGSLKSYFL